MLRDLLTRCRPMPSFEEKRARFEKRYGARSGGALSERWNSMNRHPAMASKRNQLLDVPTVEWWDFLENHFRWEQGEHLTAIGPTGAGKTTLSMALLPVRRYIVATGTKPKDPTLKKLQDEWDFTLLRQWIKLSPELYPKRLIWPDATDLHSAQKQREIFMDVFEHIYREGGWCVYIDEMWYFIHHLKMEKEVKTFLQQSRSNGISMMLLTQRPAFVPLECYDQSTHLFFARDNDERNLQRISGIAWLSAKTVRETVASLARYQWLYINTKTGELVKTTPPPPPNDRGGIK